MAVVWPWVSPVRRQVALVPVLAALFGVQVRPVPAVGARCRLVHRPQPPVLGQLLNPIAPAAAISGATMLAK